MKIFLTGGTGFIGSNLAERLTAEGHDLFCMIRKSSNAEFLRSLNVHLLLQDEVLAGEHDFAQFDICLHLAAIRHKWGTSEEAYRTSTLHLTKRLLDLSLGKIEQFIFCSSIAVFGWPPQLPISDENPYAPVSLYGKLKVEAEKLIFRYHEEKGLPVTVVRPSITYGRRDYTGMVTKLILMLNSGTYRTVGSGKNRVQLCYIDDLIDGFMAVLGNQKAIGEGFIITAENPISINRLVDIICENINNKPPKIKIPVWFARCCATTLEASYKLGIKLTGAEPIIANERIDVMTEDRAYDISKAKKVLGYEPNVDYEEGIKRTVDWVLKNE